MDQDVIDKPTQRIASKTAQLSLNSGSLYPYEDVTELLENATKDLKTGELIQLETFSLFDAMCAIVIMDPKMDTGMILDEYANLPQYDINRPINPKEFIWIFDNILSGQMTWLSGHALSQTLFTSCYILRVFEINMDSESTGNPNRAQQATQQPKEFVTLVLRSCALAIAKSCALIWDEMKKGQVYEEEDFMTNLFGVTLYENYPTGSLMVSLDQAEYWMEELGKQWIDSNYGPESTNVYRGVMERIQYARNFFIQFAAQKPAPGAFPRSILQTVLYDDQVIMGSRMVQEVIRESIQETVAPAQWIFEIFDELPSDLDKVKASSLRSIPEHDESELSTMKRQIQSRLLLFIEKAIRPFVDTLQIVGQNTSRQRRNLRKIVQLWEGLQGEAERFDDDVHVVLAEMRAQQESETIESPPPEVILQPFYFVSWVYHMKLWVMEWLLLLGFELELYSTFEYSMIYAYVDCVLGAHAQHLRRVQTVVESESQAGGKDNLALKKKKKKKKKPTGSVDKPQTTSEANLSSQASPDIGSNSSLPDVDTTETSQAAASGSVSSTAISTPAIRATQDVVTIRLQLARGVFLILAALTKVGHISITPPHLDSHGFNDLNTLFRHRFEPFHNLSSPEAMSYANFLQRLDCEGLDAWQILEYATDFFSQAKAALDRLQSFSARDARIELCEDAWRKDVKNMIRVCIASRLAITALHKDARILEQKEFTAEAQKRAAMNVKRPIKGKDKLSDKSQSLLEFKAPTRRIHFEWKYHTWWPVITLA
ncbi:hypothetical protein BGZ76_001357 [Entomortierella beljakovae]|nr:hypothetical protein BGZ76_001357 [Entomortierella beljakovae]